MPKTTVEDCTALDLDSILRRRRSFTIENGLRIASGSLTWSWAGEARSSIGFAVVLDGEEGTLRLRYTARRTGEAVDEGFKLVSRRPHFGGRRYFAICPSCGRRAVRLYLPPGGTRFRCRECHSLTYESRQRHNKRVDHYLKNPVAAEAAWSTMRAGGRVDVAALHAGTECLRRQVNRFVRSFR